MGKQLLFTEDELYSNNPYDHVEEEDKPKAEAIKQWRYNDSALKWLRTVYHEQQGGALTDEEVMSHPVTIADAFKFYADFMRKRHAENPTYETQQLLNDARRGESICSMILLQRKNLKMILWDYAVIQVAEKALKCWNDVLPYKTAATAGDQEPKTPGRKEKLSMDIFEKEIWPEMKQTFPDSKHVTGKKAYCTNVGKKYGVNEKTIRDKFDICNNRRGATM